MAGDVLDPSIKCAADTAQPKPVRLPGLFLHGPSYWRLILPQTDERVSLLPLQSQLEGNYFLGDAKAVVAVLGSSVHGPIARKLQEGGR